MIENTVVIAAATCSNSDAFTTMTTDAAEESPCPENPKIEAMPELIPQLQTQ